MKSIVRLAIESQLQPNGEALSLEEEAELTAEVEQTEVQVVKDLEEAERALEVTQALEDLAFVANTITEATPREAALIQIAADAATAGTGVDGSVIAPSMEEGSDGKGVGERIKIVIERIIKALKDLMVQIYKKLKEFLDGSERLVQSKKSRLKELAKSAKGISGFNSASIDVVPLYKFNNRGDVETIHKSSQMISALSDHEKFIKDYVKGSSIFLTRIESLVDQFYSSVGDGGQEIRWKTITELVDRQSLAFLSKYTKDFTPSTSSEKVRMVGEEFLCGLRVEGHIGVVKYAKDSPEQEIADAFRAIIDDTYLITGTSADYSIPKEKIKMTALTPKEIVDVVEKAIDLSDECLKSTGRGSLAGELVFHVEKFETLVSKLSKIAENLGKLEGDELRNAMPYLNTINTVSMRLSRLAVYAYRAAIGVNMRIVDRCIAVVDASIKAQSKLENAKS